MKISATLKDALELAAKEAANACHEFVTLEHLLYAFTMDEDIRTILTECGANLAVLRQELVQFLSNELPVIPEEFREQADGPVYSLNVQFALQVAAAHVESSAQGDLYPIHVLIAFYRTKESHAVYFLESQSIRRFTLVRYVSELKHHEDYDADVEDDEFAHEEADSPKSKLKPDILINLNERAEKGDMDPLVGRDDELDRAIHVLARRRKNNPVFVGEAGVGKTALAEGLAWKIVQGEVPSSLKGCVLYALDMGRLVAGTRYRGDFEERLQRVIKEFNKKDNAVLVIDEIHTVIGAGALSSGGLDATNILKPYLARGDLRCIGTTTQQEYRRVFEKDQAMARRFQKIDVDEPSDADALVIVTGLVDRYELFHGVTYSSESLEAAVHLSSVHLRNKYQPDKALDVVDEVGAMVKLKTRRKKRVTVKDVEGLICKMAKIPALTVKRDDQSRLRQLGVQLKHEVFGQDETVATLVEAVYLARSGLAPDDKPIGSFLFAGPTGVGKTEMCKQLADKLGVAFLRFDMSEYMEKHTVSRLIGSPPGYVGHDEGGQLTEAVVKDPHAVVLLDEIEKAHPDIFNILLQVMDHATLTDNVGRKADFRQVILILTTNEGARESQQTPIGFNKPEFEDKSKQALEKLFSPEFRNRLTAVCQFNRLDQSVVKEVVWKNVQRLEKRLLDKGIVLDVKPTAVSYFVKHGYTPELGARPMERLVQAELAKPLSKLILFGKLKKGGRVKVTAKKDQLVIDV